MKGSLRRAGWWVAAAGMVCAVLHVTRSDRVLAQEPAPPPPAQGAPPAQAPRPTQPSFRAGIDLVSLNVTVTDANLHYVKDLEQSDFSVFEDGQKQDVTFFNRTNLPIALALMIDTSASMDTKLATAQEAATGFVRRLRQQDVAEIIDFDS